VDPEDRGPLNVATRWLISAIDIQETLIRHKQGKPPKGTGRDLDTYTRERST